VRSVFLGRLSPRVFRSQPLRGHLSRSLQADKDVGFSIELWEAIAKDLGTDFTIKRHENFSDKLQAVQNGESNAAVANISITAAREATMDFSHPIFSSGLRTMIPLNPETNFSIFRTILSWEILLAVLGAFAVLLAVGGWHVDVAIRT
jgi:polar amino acid transport system substrate-binding protein